MDGIGLGEGDGIEEGLVDGNGVDGKAVGLGEGIKVGSADNGVGLSVVGSLVGLGVGTVEGSGLGETVGTTVGAGVVGDGVITFVGDWVGDGVGIQVEHSNRRVKVSYKIIQSCSPMGGLTPNLSVASFGSAEPSTPLLIFQ
jgi:hypothetical protein